MEWKNTSFSNHFITFFCCSGCVDDDGWLGERKRGSAEKLLKNFFFFLASSVELSLSIIRCYSNNLTFFHRYDTSGSQANRQLLKRTWCVMTPYAKWHQFIQPLECQNWISKVHVWQLVNALRSPSVWRHGVITQPHGPISVIATFFISVICSTRASIYHIHRSSNLWLVWLVRQEQ